ncbi:AAA family ATPase [Verrucomicrobiota bacterium]
MRVNHLAIGRHIGLPCVCPLRGARPEKRSQVLRDLLLTVWRKMRYLHIRAKTVAQARGGMARSDLLLGLVKAGMAGDATRFRQAAEAVIAEERAKNHNVLADQLQCQLAGTENGKRHEPSLQGAAPLEDLLFESTPHRHIGELSLPEHVSAAVRELVEEQQRHDLLLSYNLQPRNRVLLTGAPGNGKTTLAEAIAEALMLPLVVLRYDGVIGSFLGETASRLKKVFDYVRTRRCVLFLDEFDTLGKERGDVHDTGEIKRVVSSLLLQIDAIPTYVVVVTATNHPELLDRAVWRRFQLRLELPRPTRTQIEAWMPELAQRFGFDFEYSSRRLADSLYGCSFAELEQFALDVARQRVLRMPESNVRDIVRLRLKQWRKRFAPQQRPAVGEKNA